LQPERPIPLIAFHARNDHAARYQRSEYKGQSYPSVFETILAWANACGCSHGPDTIRLDKEVYKIRWYNDSTDTEVELWTTPDGKHTWPGGKGIPFPGSGRPSKAINANQEIWEFFFQRHR
jgi:poly(3-hydroxybutyrate) depolymerase